MAPHISAHTTTIPNLTKHKTSSSTTHHVNHHHNHSAANNAITMMMVMKGEGVEKQEKHIAVDPVSLQHQQSAANNNKNSIGPLPLHPPKLKFLSMSQPNSPNNKKSPAALILHKSKSCGEGRTTCPPPSHDLDLWSLEIKNDDSPNNIHYYLAKPEEAVKESPKRSSSGTINSSHAAGGKGFRCGCLYIPGLYGKGKTVRHKKEASNNSSITDDDDGGGVISRTVSLEKFECGSWAPSPSPRAFNPDQAEGNDSVSSYFDLPSELIRCHSPVAAAFVFDNYKEDVRGVLKKGASARGRKSDASPTRHVRFSTPSSPSSPASSSSSSTCITPRLRKARDEFNAFLRAHSTTA